MKKDKKPTGFLDSDVCDGICEECDDISCPNHPLHIEEELEEWEEDEDWEDDW